MSRHADVVVVGGGVIGCAVSYALAREGLAVTLLERGALAGEASGAAAGMLTPIVEAPEAGPFLRLGLRALDAFPGWIAELRALSGVDPEWIVSGVLRVASSEVEARRLRPRADRLAAHGIAWLEPAALHALEPALASGLLGGLHSPRAAQVRSPLLVRACAEAAAALGARIEAGVPVRGLLRERARVVGVQAADGPRPAGVVVFCTGSFTRECAAWIDPHLELPITPLRGQIVCLDAPRPPFARIVWGEGAYLVPKADGSVVVGATEEHVGFDRRVTAAGVRQLLEAAPKLVPGLADASFRGAWAGLRPSTPDGLPLIGPLPSVDGLVLAAGHHRTGVLLSPLTAELVRDGLLGKGWPEAELLPERWLRPARSADAQ